MFLVGGMSIDMYTHNYLEWLETTSQYLVSTPMSESKKPLTHICQQCLSMLSMFSAWATSFSHTSTLASQFSQLEL
jgi:hypothetical protein